MQPIQQADIKSQEVCPEERTSLYTLPLPLPYPSPCQGWPSNAVYQSCNSAHAFLAYKINVSTTPRFRSTCLPGPPNEARLREHH